jgi:hypothetical protein
MSVTRVRYRERQRLRAADLNHEQAYRVAMRRRHNISHHTWGIAHGLKLVVEAGDFFVQPGVAVDGYGRELIVPEPVSLPMTVCDEAMNIFDALQSEAIDVWLLYGRVAETPPQRGRWDCGPGRHSRWREEARLRLTPANTIDPRQPVEVPEADLDFGPHEVPPDDPEREWPVYLGRITRPSTSPDTGNINMANRPYVALIGETVTAPSGRARMQVGSEVAGGRRRFAVSLPDETGAFTDRIAIDRDGNTTVRGNTTLDGDLIIAGAETRPVQNGSPSRFCGCDGDGDESTEEKQAWGVAFDPMDAPPEEAAPWQIYHTVVSKDDVPIHQLRLEIGHPGDEGDPAKHRLASGSWSDDANRFQPCLTVAADCTVTIRGNVQVEGKLSEGPITADPTDPRFTGVVGTRWAQGLLVTGAGIIYGTGLNVMIDSWNFSDRDTTVTYNVTVRNETASTIANIHVVENLSVGGQPVRRGWIKPEFDLAAESQQTISSTYHSVTGPFGDREIVLAITAFGIGPANVPISASATKTLEPFEGPD